jgi:phenylalanyl-tRNA synthetase beta chain
MIVTRSWLQEFVDISKISTEEICKTLNSIGLEVDSVEKISIPKGVVVGKVLEKSKHPDADKLNVCLVDIGTEVVQIVCGAKNVQEDQFVPVATVGTILGDDFKIKAAKLRGVDSNGMICSSTEIGLSKLNDGILVLDDSIGKLSIGANLCDFALLNDEIIEIELTANRGDCLSIYGIARELSTYYKLPIIEDEKISISNDFGIGQILEIDCASNIESSLMYKVADFSSFSLPLLYKIRAAIANVYCNNEIQTALRYVTHCVGVLLKVYAKSVALSKNNLAVFHIKKDKNGFDCVWGNEFLNTIGVGANVSLQDEDTYILEASYVDPELISKKVFETKIKTDDIFYRSSRGSEPDIHFGMDYLTSLISKNGAKLYAGSESFIEDKEKITLDVCTKKINAIIGQKTSKAKIDTILSALGFEVKDTSNNVLSIKIPLFRHDIKNIADVTEEIVRMIGIDNIKSQPLAIDEVNRNNKCSQDLIKKNQLRQRAIANGFFETITYIFSSKELLEKYQFETLSAKKDILNPITHELNTYRTTMLLNLVQAASNNFKMGYKKVALFEIGTIFNAHRNEFKKIAFIFSGQNEAESFSNHGKPNVINFFEFAQKVLNVIGTFELQAIQNVQNGFIHPYQSANIIVQEKEVGYISKLHPSVAADFDLPDTFIAQIDFDAINTQLNKAQAYSKFQSSRRDLSIVVPKELSYQTIKEVITNLKNQRIKQFNLVDIYSDDKLQDNQSLTLRFILQDDHKTLEEEDISATMDEILTALNSKLCIQIRQ